MAPRDIKLTIRLINGDCHEVRLGEDAPELATLFGALASPSPEHSAENQFVELPLEGGRVAWSFRTSNVVSILSDPPVVLNPEQLKRPAQTEARADGSAKDAAGVVNQTAYTRRPRFVVVDDFLAAEEHDELLAYALVSEDQFQPGTVSSYEPGVRQNQAIMNFGESVHSRFLENRLLIWFPLLAKTLGIPMFPLSAFESQLTAARDGYYFKTHSDESPDIPRVLTCIYYLHREPRGFAGGELRLYDCIGDGDERRAAETFATVHPTANRLVVFASNELHEARPVRCPSVEFADSRFAVTMWMHRAKEFDPLARFGWGHFSCGVLPPQLRKPKS